ncbi:MAG: hypothetical protein JWM42_1299 [Burkholderia sp.]|nr:hypothetical protein [Burkholderia sp.]
MRELLMSSEGGFFDVGTQYGHDKAFCQCRMPARASWKRTEAARADLPVNITNWMIQNEALRLPHLAARSLPGLTQTALSARRGL